MILHTAHPSAPSLGHWEVVFYMRLLKSCFPLDLFSKQRSVVLLLISFQLKKIYELVSIFPGGKVYEVLGQAVAQIGAGLDRDFTVRTTEGWRILLQSVCLTDVASQIVLRCQLFPSKQQRVCDLPKWVKVDQPHLALGQTQQRNPA